ncbi:MAG: hydrogenase maturation nickel metallochaperone HypA [Lachnospiraceae bacterium]|nr:hydrogenase maturation nickel metallochaperone HypA [Lachnospiraceae bacterium]
MHEMSYMVALVKEALEYCDENHIDGEKVDTVCVEVGEMTGVLPEFLYKYYPDVIRDTVLAGSHLDVAQMPVEIECASCRKHYHPEAENGYACPHCHGKDGSIIKGRECTLSSLTLKE